MLSHGAALLSCDGKGWWRCIKSSNCTHLCCHLQELGRLPFWKAKKMAETIQSCRLVVAWLAFVKHPSSGLSRVVYVWSVHVCVSLCLCVSLSPCVSTSLCLSRARVCVCGVCVCLCVCGVGWACYRSTFSLELEPTLGLSQTRHQHIYDIGFHVLLCPSCLARAFFLVPAPERSSALRTARWKICTLQSMP